MLKSIGSWYDVKCNVIAKFGLQPIQVPPCADFKKKLRAIF